MNTLIKPWISNPSETSWQEVADEQERMMNGKVARGGISAVTEAKLLQGTPSISDGEFIIVSQLEIEDAVRSHNAILLRSRVR